MPVFLPSGRCLEWADRSFHKIQRLQKKIGRWLGQSPTPAVLDDRVRTITRGELRRVHGDQTLYFMLNAAAAVGNAAVLLHERLGVATRSARFAVEYVEGLAARGHVDILDAIMRRAGHEWLRTNDENIFCCFHASGTAASLEWFASRYPERFRTQMTNELRWLTVGDGVPEGRLEWLNGRGVDVESSMSQVPFTPLVALRWLRRRPSGHSPSARGLVECVENFGEAAIFDWAVTEGVCAVRDIGRELARWRLNLRERADPIDVAVLEWMRVHRVRLWPRSVAACAARLGDGPALRWLGRWYPRCVRRKISAVVLAALVTNDAPLLNWAANRFGLGSWSSAAAIRRTQLEAVHRWPRRTTSPVTSVFWRC